MISIKRIIPLIFACLVPLTGPSAMGDDSRSGVVIMTVDDFPQLAKTARDQGKLIMLEISASDCSYCFKLEEEILKPMVLSGDYDADVLIRKVDIDGSGNLRNFDGQIVSRSSLARAYNIKVTPTLIFLNSQNQEVSKRIVGVNSLDLFGAYVDEAIENGLAIIR